MRTRWTRIARRGGRPATVQAMCEDYRAGFGIDSDLDRDDRAAGRRITAPLLAFVGQPWCDRGVVLPVSTVEPVGR